MTLHCDRDRLFALFQGMVDIYSPSGKEAELGAFLQNELRGGGLQVEMQPVDGVRANLLVSTGKGIPDTLFLGHIDTVPAYDIGEYGFALRDGVCRGLGTADMKGGCAALVEAFRCAAEQGVLPDSVLLALVVGEEESGDGTRALLDAHRFKAALVAEPTDLNPCLAHYGYVEMTVRTFGRRRHAAMSDRDTNAIRAMLRFLLELEDRIEGGEPETVLNMRDLHSSESGFAVPDRCAASVDLHIPPGIRATEYADGLRRFAEAALSSSRASRHEVEFQTLADGYRVSPEDPLARSARTVFDRLGLPWNPTAFKSHSDANLLQETGCLPMMLGPGELAKAHTIDESIAFEQVAAAADVYAGLLPELGPRRRQGKQP